MHTLVLTIIVVSFGAVVVSAGVIVDLSLVTLHHDGFFSLSRAADYQFSITSDGVFATVDKIALSILLSRDDVTLDGDGGGTRLLPLAISLAFSVHVR
jgi:hypothetical protein